MILKHQDIEINPENPFVNCKLGRLKYAEILTGILQNYADGFVLAINNEWGTGKTTFVKMWRQHLENKSFQTLYFNAWENDFESNPLVAIISELKTLIGDTENRTFKSLLKKGATLSKSIIPVLAKSLADKYIKIEPVSEAIKEISKGAMEVFEQEVDEYAAKKKNLTEFKIELEKYVSENRKNKEPIIFIIDELDRCRPDYAVEVLENVKHFFAVSGIVFILSIDKDQLSNSIKGYYGSDDINGTEYLRRFIDLEYHLPTPKSIDFCNYLYSYFQFEIYFADTHRTQHQELRFDGRDFIEFASNLAEKANLTLRQQEKLFSHSRVALNQFKHNHYVFPSLFLFLIFIRDYNSLFYKKIKNREISLQDLVDEMDIKYSINEDLNKHSGFFYTKGLLLLLYNNYYRQINHKSSLFEIDSNSNQLRFTISSNVFKGEKTNAFENLMRQLDGGNFTDVPLTHILNKVEFTEYITY